MTDSSLRLHQRAAAQGDVDAEAKHLRQRLRAGTLSKARIELSAYCGSKAARTFLEWKPCPYGIVVQPDGMILHAIDGYPGWEVTETAPPAMPSLPSTLSGLVSDMRSIASGIDVGVLLQERCEGQNERNGCHKGKKTHGLNKVLIYDLCEVCQGTGLRSAPWDGGGWVILRATRVTAELAYVNAGCEHYGGGQRGWCLRCGPRVLKAIEACKSFGDSGTLEACEAWGDAVVACGMIRWVPDSEPVAIPVRLEEIQEVVRVLDKPCDELGNYGHNAHVCGCFGSTRLAEAKVRSAICAELLEWCLE